MKTIFVLVFFISVLLLSYLSTATKVEKPTFTALSDITLYDRINCMEKCADHKVLGVIKNGETFTTLSQLKAKTKEGGSVSVLRIESTNAAGWTLYDEATMLENKVELKSKSSHELD